MYNKNWKDVPIPAKMQHLERDKRGFPIPVVVLRDENNKPHFQINDDRETEKCIAELRCSICGDKMDNDDMWLVGGNLSAFHPNGAYIDPPVHHECGQYALQVCPYLAAPSYNKRLDDKTLNKDNFKGMTFMDPTVTPGQPDYFVFNRVLSGYTVTRRGINRYIKVNPSIGHEYEFWRNGKEFTNVIAKLVKEKLDANPELIK